MSGVKVNSTNSPVIAQKTRIFVPFDQVIEHVGVGAVGFSCAFPRTQCRSIQTLVPTESRTRPNARRVTDRPPR